jgi:hypothetical protein
MKRKEYVNSESLVLDNPEVERLELVIELYEREQQGIRIAEKDEEEVKSRIYKRLGELLQIEPNMVFMGEKEHGSLL